MLLGACTWRQSEVAQKQRNGGRFSGRAQGPDWKETPGAPVLCCLTPALPRCCSMCSHQPLLPKLLSQLWISASSSEINSVSILCYPLLPVCFLCPSSPQAMAVQSKQPFITPYRRREELQPGRAFSWALSEPALLSSGLDMSVFWGSCSTASEGQDTLQETVW